MKTLVLLVCHCGAPVPPPPFGGCAFNHPAVIMSLIWAVAIVLLGGFVLCYLNKRMKMKKMMIDSDRLHELDLKEEADKHERFWFFLNHELSMEECQKKLKETSKKLKEYEKKEKELNEGSENLKNEKEEFEKTILEEKVKAYKDIIKYIGRCVQ